MDHKHFAALASTLCLITSACQLSDAKVEREAGGPCGTPDARVDGLLCRDGIWVPDTTGEMLDMAKDSSARHTDLGKQDMLEDLAECVPETDAEICASLNRCAIEMSVVDNCEEVRQVRCPDRCAQGICIPATGLCEGDCTPQACPPTLTCGRASNGCGAMQLCDACPAGSLCDPEAEECVCDTSPDLCMNNNAECGVINEATGCPVDCGPCATGFCMNNQCQSAEVLTSNTVQRDARFGEHLHMHEDLLVVASPGFQHLDNVGNAEIFEHESGQWSIVYDTAQQAEDNKVHYSGYGMGASVAIGSNPPIALVGKRHIDAAPPYPPDIHLLHKDNGQWFADFTVQGEGIEPGNTVLVHGNRAIVGSPRRNAKGQVNIYTLVNGAPDMLDVYTFRPSTNEPDGNLGRALAALDDTLVMGNPKYDANRGRCEVARVSASNDWNISSYVEAQAQGDGTFFCAQVAIHDDVLAVLLRDQTQSDGMQASIVQIFTRVSAEQWSHVQSIMDPATDVESQFGEELIFGSDGDLFISDARWDSPDGLIDTGIVYHYTRQSGQPYTLSHTLMSNTPQESGRFGASFATSGKTLMVGAPGEMANGNENAGVVYEFTLP